MADQNIHRREFLKRSARAGVGAALAAGLFPSRVLGANERVVLGVIGSGGRGRNVTRAFQQFGASVAAVCDVYTPNQDQAMQMAGSSAKRCADFRQVLDNKDVDAVLIATPDHHHCEQLIAAVQAGKDVYVEKPLSHSIEEGVRMVKAVRGSKRVVQVGMQRRSSEAMRKAKGLIDEGKIGRVTMVKAQWNWNRSRPLDNSPLAGALDWKRFVGPAKERPLEPMRFRAWRNFWDYSGGHMTDQGTHLMDVVRWFTNAPAPHAAVCMGSVYKMSGAETPDIFSAVFEYPGLMATWTLTYCNDYQNGWSIFFQGDGGTMELDDMGYRLYGTPWKPGAAPVFEFKGGIPTEPHVQNFLDCIKSRQDPNAPIEVGHLAVAGPHLANQAYFKKQRVTMPDLAAS